MLFVPAGDKGDTGAFATWTLISTVTISGTPSTVTFSSIPQTYSDLLVVCAATLSAGSGAFIALSANGASFTSAQQLNSDGALTEYRGSILVAGYRQDYQSTYSAIASLSGSSPIAAVVTGPYAIATKIVGGVSALRLSLGATNFLSGSITLLGK